MKYIFVLLAALVQAAMAAPLTMLSTGFDDVGALSGWQFTNQSTPQTGQSWMQGNTGVFDAQDAGNAPSDAYIAANFLSASNGIGVIDNWLITPYLFLSGPSRLSFYTRSAGAAGFADRLEIRFSSQGAATSNFDTLLLVVGDSSDYPDTWRQFVAEIDYEGGAYFAFRYQMPADMADYIGIDSVSVVTDSVDSVPVPEPGALTLTGAGLVMLAWQRRRDKTVRRSPSFALQATAIARGTAGPSNEGPT